MCGFGTTLLINDLFVVILASNTQTLQYDSRFKFISGIYGNDNYLSSNIYPNTNKYFKKKSSGDCIDFVWFAGTEV